jgi:hypothetical protein
MAADRLNQSLVDAITGALVFIAKEGLIRTFPAR